MVPAGFVLPYAAHTFAYCSVLLRQQHHDRDAALWVTSLVEISLLVYLGRGVA
jgi:hypothetical protein